MSGSIDGKVRMWNIPEQRVVDYADVHEMVTATAFSVDGKKAIVGTMKGKCRFYQCEPDFKLEYEAQIGEFPWHPEHLGFPKPWSMHYPMRCRRCKSFTQYRSPLSNASSEAPRTQAQR